MTELQSMPRTANHYGAYRVRVEAGRVRELLPVEGDEDPSPIGNALAESVDSPLRIAEPAVRRSWLDHGPGAATERRGAEPFVAVSWDEAERLVAAEIERVRRTHGNASIFAGSYGWGSAGQFHHAQGHLYRLLNLAGGFTRSVNTYSLAAAENIMPHVMGPFPWLQGQHTSWPSIIEHTELMVCFGGMPLKNSQINYRGVARHTQRGYMREAREAGIAFVNVGPLRDDVADFLDAEWLPARPNSDVAIMLGLAHTLLEEDRHDADFLSRYCVGFERFAAYLRGDSDGRSKDVAWAAELSGLDRGDPAQARAAHGGLPHHDQHELVAEPAGPRRAALLDRRRARGDAGAGRAARRRRRLRLRGDLQHGAALPPHALGGTQPPAPFPSMTSFRSRASPTCCSIPAPPSTSTAAGCAFPTCACSTGSGAIPSTITRTSTGCCARGVAPRRWWCTSPGGPRLRATPTSCCRPQRRSSATTS